MKKKLSLKKQPTASRKQKPKEKKQIGYAVVGLGWISQVAALPAFRHAKKNSKLVALVSSDEEKLQQLGKKYKVPHLYLADQYDECLLNPEVDVVYLALPNSMHAEYTIRAAKFGKHVLCEKPMATNSRDCERMIDACERNNVKLMVAYRLHFDRANLQTIEQLKAGEIGEPRIFESVYSYQLKDESNSRLQGDLGGGPLFDIGIYCINAARYLFQSEPTEVGAFLAKGNDPRFTEVEESVSALLKFPQGMLAQFTCSFGASDESAFSVIGSKGRIKLDRAFELTEDRIQEITVEEKTKKKLFPKGDQFAPEFLYFSKCILENKKPEPSGVEGLIDVHIIESLYESIKQRRMITLERLPRKAKPGKELEVHCPPVSEPDLIHAIAPAA